MRQREDGGSQIKTEAFDLLEVQLAPNLSVLFDNLNVKTFRSKGYGRCEASQSRPDNEDRFVSLGRRRYHEVVSFGYSNHCYDWRDLQRFNRKADFHPF